jgi:hypothetical protein
MLPPASLVPAPPNQVATPFSAVTDPETQESTQRTAPYAHQRLANASSRSMPAFTACVPPLLHRILGPPSPQHLLIPFAHQLPPLLQKPAPPPARTTSQQAHAIPDRLSQAPIQPLSLDSQRTDIKRDLTSEAPQLAAPTSSPRIGDTDDAIPCPTILEDTTVFLSTIPNIPQPPEADTWQRCVLLDTGQHLILEDSNTARVSSGEPKHSASATANNSEAAGAIYRRSNDDNDFALNRHQSPDKLLPTWPATPHLYPTSQAAHKAKGSASQAPIRTLSLDSQGIDIARNISSEVHTEAAPPSEYSARKTDTPSAHIGEPEHRIDVTTNADDFTSDLERSASDSADNPSVTKSTNCHTTDECYDERIARGEGDVGIGDSSEAEARAPSY